MFPVSALAPVCLLYTHLILLPSQNQDCSNHRVCVLELAACPLSTQSRYSRQLWLCLHSGSTAFIPASRRDLRLKDGFGKKAPRIGPVLLGWSGQC